MKNAKHSTAFLAQTYRINIRTVQRLLSRDPPAPLAHWWDMPDWYAGLSSATQSKLSRPFREQIRLRADLKRWPKAGTMQINLWLTAAQDACERGQPLNFLPESIIAWMDSPEGQRDLAATPARKRCGRR